MQFYESDDFLFNTVSDFLGEGLAIGQPVVLVATAEHRYGFSSRLKDIGFDFEKACRGGQIIDVDAHSALQSFMVADMPDEDLFRRKIGGAIEEGLGGRPDATVRAYGEMVDVLWRQGNSTAAIRLEELWNGLAETYSFSLLCAYAMVNFYTEAHARELAEICRHHRNVMPAETYTISGDEQRRSREIVLLQQRALSLENEVAHRKELETALRETLAERTRAEIELKRARDDADRANRVKSEFLAVMSHELRGRQGDR